MQMVGIPPNHVPVYWDAIRGGIRKMLDKGMGNHTEEQIFTKAVQGEWMLFLIEENAEPVATIICSITEGEKKVFEIGMAWGAHMDEWLDEVDESLTRVARELGCDVMAITGRRGWVRTLADRGFSERMVIVTREL